MNSPTMDHSMDSWKHAVEGVCIAFPVLAIFSVAIRLQARRTSSAGLKLDDYLVVFALILTIGAAVNTYYSVHVNGLADVNPKANGFTMQQVSNGRKGLYAFLTLMYTAFGVIKLSIIALYKRIFTIRGFAIAANIMYGIVTAWMIGTVLANIFSNWPVSGFWLPKAAQVLSTNRSIKYADYALASAVLDFVLDVAILLMPLPVISRLKINRRKKIFLIGIFWLGFFCVIASIVKIWICTRVKKVTPATPLTEVAYNNYNVLLWFTIEASVSIVAACLPTFGPIGRHPAVRGITSALRSVSNSMRSVGNDGTSNSRARTQGSGSGTNGTNTAARGPGWQEINENPMPTSPSDAKAPPNGGILVEKSFATEKTSL